jgi:hypothetical protein
MGFNSAFKRLRITGRIKNSLIGYNLEILMLKVVIKFSNCCALIGKVHPVFQVTRGT